MTAPCVIISHIQGRLHRCDRDSSGIVRVRGVEMPPDASPSAIIAAARVAGGKMRTPIWILTDTIQPVVLTLDERTVQGMPDEELGSALAFEAQAFTNLEPDAAALAWTRCSAKGDRAFWTSSLPIAMRDAWETAIVAQGGQCAGLAHPAGVPRALIHGHSAWRRVERWRDLIAVVSGDGGGLTLAMQRTDARRWLDDGVATEHLAGPGMVEFDARPLVSLDDEGGITQWLGAWIEALEAQTPVVPVIRIPQRPVPTTRLVALAIALGFLSTVAIWLARGAIDARKEETLRALGAQQRPVQELADLRKRIAELKPKADAAVAEHERRRERQRTELERRRRCLHAIASVGGSCPPGTVIDEIAISIDTGRIAGRCVAQESAARFASDLSASLGQVGYVTTPADTRVDGRLRRFVIQWAIPRPRERNHEESQ